MITKVRVKNFKCFGESGGDFELAPLTFLFGDNSAGKSTVLQALDIVKDSGSLTHERFVEQVFRHEDNRTISITVQTTDDSDVTVDLTTTFTNGNPLAFRADDHNNGSSRAAALHALDGYEHIAAVRPDIAKDIASGLGALGLEQGLKEARERPEAVNRMLSALNVKYRLLEDLESLQDEVLGIRVSLASVGTGIHCLVKTLLSLQRLHSLQKMGEAPGILAIEEPEGHLHPKQLPAFARLLVEQTVEQPNTQRIVECHSDLVTMAVRYLVRDGKISKDLISILQVTRTRDGSQVGRVQLAADGTMCWPHSIFRERSDLLTRGLP